MRRYVSLFCCLLVIICSLLTSCGSSTDEPVIPQSLKILCIGNSFSANTLEHVADIALAVGIQDVKIANLYIGGCSINKHYQNATKDLNVYEYHVNDGSGWKSTTHHKISKTIQSEEWDWISIQHGTADGSRYAEENSYKNLAALTDIIRNTASENTKIAFNMTWVGEANSHEEMIASFKNNQLRYYKAVAALTQTLIEPIENIDIISPTGTAVQNLRTSSARPITRDKYHLTEDLGCYAAGLTFFSTLTGLDIREIEWAPEGLTAYEKQVCIEAAMNAVAQPYAVTESTIEKTATENESQ